MIRQAVITDLESIEEGYREHFLHEKKYGAYTVFREGVYPTRKDAEKALRNNALYVFEENGAVLGSIILDGYQPDEYRKIAWASQVADEEVTVIHLLMVRPCAAGKGVGSALVNFAAETAK
ncbi:MAG: GNAT family N-acetyltransferase [Ruminococcus sp.]|nr:GNAT family N-acetyltransferase [Ruminococcus sp.]